MSQEENKMTNLKSEEEKPQVSESVEEVKEGEQVGA